MEHDKGSRWWGWSAVLGGLAFGASWAVVFGFLSGDMGAAAIGGATAAAVFIVIGLLIRAGLRRWSD